MLFVETAVGFFDLHCEPRLQAIRYICVRNPLTGQASLQISQLVALDSEGQNVARGKACTASTVWEDSRPETAVDGVMASRKYPQIFHGGCPAGDWWQVDLGRACILNSVIYYNRADYSQRMNGGVLQLYDDSHHLFREYRMTGLLRQECQHASGRYRFDLSTARDAR